MSAWATHLDRYLTIRRSLGYHLGTAARILRRFIAFAEAEHAESISTDLFLRWQQSFGQANRHTWSRRLGTVRLFAQWLHGIDPRHDVPPQALNPVAIAEYVPISIARTTSGVSSRPLPNCRRSTAFAP